jgi:hypothetical protein
MSNFEAKYGFEPSDHLLIRVPTQAREEVLAALSEAGLPAELVTLYSVVEEVSLPDVENGFFIHTPDTVVDAVRCGQPTTVNGSLGGRPTDGARIAVFGSDGGGGLFALYPSDGRVYRLSGGSLIGGTYDIGDDDIAPTAEGLGPFLDHVRAMLAETASAG